VGAAVEAAAAEDATGPRVRLVQLPLRALRALAAADLDTANAFSPVRLTPYFIQLDQRGTWLRRATQVRADPAAADWVTGVIWALDIDAPVGRAGFHGPPDERGMVEIGYSVDPSYRRRGYARAAFAALLARAQREPSVHVVRVSIAPDNDASMAVIAPFGFAKVGEQWDAEDGLEMIYEIVVSAH
jgi:RimJ/RimL family protein N-acetyltransferase